MTTLERLARIIDPEAFGLPPHDNGEFGATGRDEARSKAHMVVTALCEPSEAMIEAGAQEDGEATAISVWGSMIDVVLNEPCTDDTLPS